MARHLAEPRARARAAVRRLRPAALYWPDIDEEFGLAGGWLSLDDTRCAGSLRRPRGAAAPPRRGAR